ncbi:peptide/nickel transport system ATP-binding protein [Pseudonocardia hierapolitana]|uniref:Peptide/nickel transport system ATP-binding protein n=1 Tax=Pseudonocardia hierapolitana TaxID=1128676 RepID=A0A561SXR9_9PSEU|nr:ABC transporter ATP-binding protein [Pseudonocardia hierapolitana]TWF79659.1 peptide/nickel transport system ATP-binding protein [Pseudonocardia hierapolitana]
MSDSPLLRLRGLEVSYGSAAPVVHGVDLTVPRGHRVAIVGESGSGKSTTAAAAIGLLPGTGRVTGGTIEFDGEDVTAAGEKRLRRLRGRQIGLVPQDPMSNLNPVARVGKQIAETLVMHGMARGRAARERAVELMTEAGIPDAARRARQYPHEFSGGMRQRVLIAIALACEPQLLIADEPTSALDVTVQRQILDHLERLIAERGTSLLLITHDLGLAAERADDVVVMWQGRVVDTGPAARILRDPQHEYTERLVAAAPSVAARSRAAPAPPPAADPVPALQVTDLVKTYKVRGQREPLHAVDRVSFTVREGTTTAIVGESGSGKTTIARLVLGLEQPTSGHIVIAGRTFRGADRGARRAIRRDMQPVFQDPYGSLDPVLPVERLIDEPLRVFGIGDTASRRQRVAELLDHVALPRAAAQRHPVELSGGQRQRVAIARALALRPKLVICDEAVSALDVLVQDQILELLTQLQRELGLSYLFIAHDLAVVRLIAHDVLVMRRGRIVEHGSTAEVFDDPQDEYTRALLDAIPGAALSA